jgi:hypothetical protein
MMEFHLIAKVATILVELVKIIFLVFPALGTDKILQIVLVQIVFMKISKLRCVEAALIIAIFVNLQKIVSNANQTQFMTK